VKDKTQIENTTKIIVKQNRN